MILLLGFLGEAGDGELGDIQYWSPLLPTPMDLVGGGSRIRLLETEETTPDLPQQNF